MREIHSYICVHMKWFKFITILGLLKKNSFPKAEIDAQTPSLMFFHPYKYLYVYIVYRPSNASEMKLNPLFLYENDTAAPNYARKTDLCRCYRYLAAIPLYRTALKSNLL